NYAPAIAEAYYQNIPLIVLSADRPSSLIDCGDGQCIRQKDVFHNIIRKSVHLPENPKSEAEINLYQKEILEAINTSLSPIPGPVHINVPLAEPIYDTHEKKAIPLIENPFERKTPVDTSEKLSILKKVWSNAPKKLIIVGQQAKNLELNKLLAELIKRDDTVVMSESTSNISTQGVISNIDRVLSQISKENELNFLPDLLISIGGHIVSKKIKAYLRTNSKYEHWHIGLHTQANDTFFHLSNHIPSPVNHTLTELLKTEINTECAYSSKWKNAADNAHLLHHQFISNTPYSDLLVFESIRKSLEKSNINLHFSNSTPIRYSQLFNYNEAIHIDCNRGVSGIDGSTSTALGASLINTTKTCILTGDLSFFYDSNALWNKYLHPNFRIIVINNG
ncbi:MAG: 2-succinyl-5-enolpyruvyl-6-hydroxy-3-cyclohexene-1-carboxylic-acid synthase, partial [Bacteroidales bacterium]|nr:2-succinyl-5-enolpyruvyl-6-hydroxy-3-cyclohexene-1-carboxylic-acid synthase [Bacteroidales bacterium]